MLSEIYNWFTEGFDTKDLQEAKALLEELHGKSLNTTVQKNETHPVSEVELKHR